MVVTMLELSARGGRIAAGGGLFAGGPFTAGLIAGGLFASGLNTGSVAVLLQVQNCSLLLGLGITRYLR